MDKQLAAVALADDGFRVFPIIPNKKKPPAFGGWQAIATHNPDRARDWWSGAYLDHNIGVATGQGVLVLDFDKAKGGLASLALMDALGLPHGLLRVSTPSGGVHVYLRSPLDVGISVSVNHLKGFPGVDVRGVGGYVVGPGSSIDGVDYRRILE